MPLQKGLNTEKATLHKTASTPNDKALKAKTKLKTFQNKKSNQRLAKLEKMYQELTDMEQKN